MYNIIQKRNLWLSLSAFMFIISVISISIWGLKFGIDFTGGSLMEIKFSGARPVNEAISQALSNENLKDLYVQPVGDNGAILRMESINEEKHQAVLKKLRDTFTANIDVNTEQNVLVKKSDSGGVAVDLSQANLEQLQEVRFDSIGPSLGSELKGKAIIAIIMVLIAIIIYLAYAFRKVSRPVPSWQYGLAAVIALIHDITIVIGIFSLLGHFFDIQVDSLFVTALLTILGFSVHDTIVTFDRIRENIFRQPDKTFENVINISINETITRSINTSLTTLIVLFAIFLFGGVTIKFFVLALIIGIIFGTYSSIFIASPLVLIFYYWKYKKPAIEKQ